MLRSLQPTSTPFAGMSKTGFCMSRSTLLLWPRLSLLLTSLTNTGGLSLRPAAAAATFPQLGTSCATRVSVSMMPRAAATTFFPLSASCAGTVVSSTSAGSNRLAARGGGRCSGEDINAADVAAVSSAAGAASGASGAAVGAVSGAAGKAAGAAVGVAVVHAAVAGVAGVVAGAESFKVNVATARE